MIQNIVFDLGNVLVKFDPAYFLKDYPDSEKELFYKEIFGSENWLKMDRGALSEQELINLVKSRLPLRYHSDAEKLIKWYTLTLEIQGMEPLIRQLKKNGYSIYLLSNTSPAFHRFCKQIAALKYFDGLLISADCGFLKPEKEIFRLFCQKFSLAPNECVFIDDMPVNIQGAIGEGFAGIVFTGDVPALKEELAKLGIVTE